MGYRLRPLAVLLASTMSLAALGGCGTVQQGAATPTSSGASVPQAQGTVPVAVRTDVPGYVAPHPVPSGDVPRIVSTPVPTPVQVSAPMGDTPEAQAILDKWVSAFDSIKSVHGIQQIMLIYPDGSRRPPGGQDDPEAVVSTEEWYDSFGFRNGQWMRYRVVLRYTGGEMTSLYDGKAAYRVWSGLNEVHQPWPDVNNPSEYWQDYVGDRAMLNNLMPEKSLFSYVGTSREDGRSLIELVVKEGNYGPNGRKGTRLFLDSTLR